MSRKTPGSVQERASTMDDAVESATDSADAAVPSDSADATASEGTPGSKDAGSTDGVAAGESGVSDDSAASTVVLTKSTDAGPSVSEAELDETDEPAVESGGAGPRWPVRRVLAVARRALLPAVSVLAIVAVAAAAFFGWKVKQHNDLQAAGDAALAAARSYAVTLTSVDSNNLDRDFAAVLDGSTGEFRDMYTRSSGQLRELLVENKATGQGTVLDAAVKSASETEVEVLLFIDQTVTNTASADPRVDRSRVLMTMQLVDGRWLAARVYLP